MMRKSWEKKMGERKEKKNGDVLIHVIKKGEKNKKTKIEKFNQNFLVKLVRLVGVIFVRFYQIALSK